MLAVLDGEPDSRDRLGCRHVGRSRYECRLGQRPAGTERVHEALDLQFQLLGKELGGVVRSAPAGTKI